MKAPQETKIRITILSAITLMGMFSKEYKPSYKRDTCTLMFVAALFAIAKIWNLPRCPTGYWIHHQWCIQYGTYIQWTIIQT
jgi:hypothetical protein